MTVPHRIHQQRPRRLRRSRPRGPLVGVLLAIASLAVCVVALVWRADARAAADSRRNTAEPELQVATLPGGPTITDIVVPGWGDNGPGSLEIPVREYLPSVEPWATLVWAHGGSFVHGTLDWPEADWVSRRFAGAGVQVYSVDYALATDTVKAPLPGNDVAAVAQWVSEQAGPVAIGGASAGGHLATLAALQLAEAAEADAGAFAPTALLLEYPTLHPVQEPDEAITALTRNLPEARRFDADRIAQMYEFYLGETGTAVGDLEAMRLRLLPPTVIINADADDLRASGEQFARQLEEAGVPVTVSVQPGTVHGYLNRPEESAQARADAVATIDRFVEELRRLTP